MQSIWKDAVERCDLKKVNTDTRICSKHFQEEDFIPEKYNYDKCGRKRKRRRLKPDACPSLFLTPPLDQPPKKSDQKSQLFRPIETNKVFVNGKWYSIEAIKTHKRSHETVESREIPGQNIKDEPMEEPVSDNSNDLNKKNTQLKPVPTKVVKVLKLPTSGIQLVKRKNGEVSYVIQNTQSSTVLPKPSKVLKALTAASGTIGTMPNPKIYSSETIKAFTDSIEASIEASINDPLEIKEEPAEDSIEQNEKVTYVYQAPGQETGQDSDPFSDESIQNYKSETKPKEMIIYTKPRPKTQKVQRFFMDGTSQTSANSVNLKGNPSFTFSSGFVIKPNVSEAWTQIDSNQLCDKVIETLDDERESCNITKQVFKDDKKCRALCGIPLERLAHAKFILVDEFLELPDLTSNDQLVLYLTKHNCDLSMQNIATMFDAPLSTVKQAYLHVLKMHNENIEHLADLPVPVPNKDDLV